MKCIYEENIFSRFCIVLISVHTYTSLVTSVNGDQNLNIAVFKWHLSISIYTKTTLNRYKRGRWDFEVGKLLDFESIPFNALIIHL